MANREELSIIRGARAGRAGAQVQLGKLYLFGSTGLPRSLPTALHWLDRAAQQGSTEAWQLIGTHVPYELARQHAHAVLPWYERAFDDGIDRAGMVLARMVLGAPDTEPPPIASPQLQAKAMRALESAARSGHAEAQWLLSQQPPGALPCAAMAAPGANGAGASLAASPVQVAAARPRFAGEHWQRRAADSGVAAVQYSLLDQHWQAGNQAAFLAHALPLARRVVASIDVAGKGHGRLAPEEVQLLSRCAQAMDQHGGAADGAEQRRLWELAAQEHDRDAQLAMGLWCARMQVDGTRTSVGSGAANFKKAIRWLALAGEQGLAEAWYAMSRIYIKPEFSQRNVFDAQVYLERAAEMGYRAAQLECGNGAWRARREHEHNDVRAVYWLQKAAAQHCAQAQAALDKIAPRMVPADPCVLPPRTLASSHPLLAARLELAAAFGLSRAEALLLDIPAADCGHCLVVDIRSSYGRSKRRLIVLSTAQERKLLDRVVRLFEHVDGGPSGPEGNYRQRLYRYKTIVASQAARTAAHSRVADGAAPAADDGSDYELAA